MKLRPYQLGFVDGVFEQFARHTSTLGVMATGLGKTVCFAHCIRRACKQTGKRAMVIAHREELIYQAADKIEAIIGERPDIEMASQHANESGIHGKAQVVVASKDTLRVKKRLERFNPGDFCLLTTDEAHHAVAKSYKKIYDYFHRNPDLKHLGVTATPDRADEAALGKVYESVAFEYGINDGISDGWLVPIRQTSVTVDGLDYSKIHTVAGDLNKKELAEVLEAEKSVHEIASPAIDIVDDRKALVFAHTLKQAEQLCDVINRHRPNSARWVSGMTPKDDRRYLLDNYAAGGFQYLVNVGVFTEGFDEPGVQCVVMARPTKSRSLFTQMVGRGTRPLPGLVDAIGGDDTTLFDEAHEGQDYAAMRRAAIGESPKPYVEIIDFVGNCGQHKLVSVADVLGGNYDDAVVERAKKKAEKAGKAADIGEQLKLAEQEIHEERKRERERLQQVKAKAKYQTKSIDPFDVLDIEPWRERPMDNQDPASNKQVEAIRKMTGGKVDARDMSRRRATQLMSELVERRRTGRCTFGQAKLLSQYGYDASSMSFEAAGQIIDAIKANGWRRPSQAEPVGVGSGAQEFEGF